MDMYTIIDSKLVLIDGGILTKLRSSYDMGVSSKAKN
jgi:restriction endonuclease Mrr